MAILIILGSLILPSMVGIKGNTGIKAGVDTVRARMFDARGKAMDDGVPYRLSVSDDGKTLQVAPDDPNSVDPTTNHGSTTTEKLPDGVIVKVMAQDGVEATVDQTGWVRVATFTAEGTCRKDLIDVQVSEPAAKAAPVTIRIRGVTGAIRTIKPGGKQ